MGYAVVDQPIVRPEEPPAAPPEYEPPRVVTYRGEEILEELGPAQACSFLHSVVLC